MNQIYSGKKKRDIEESDDEVMTKGRAMKSQGNEQSREKEKGSKNRNFLGKISRH